MMAKFSMDCRKTKTTAITLASLNLHRQSIEPIKISSSKYIQPIQTAGKNMLASRNGFWFNFRLDDKVAQSLKPIT